MMVRCWMGYTVDRSSSDARLCAGTLSTRIPFAKRRLAKSAIDIRIALISQRCVHAEGRSGHVCFCLGPLGRAGIRGLDEAPATRSTSVVKSVPPSRMGPARGGPTYQPPGNHQSRSLCSVHVHPFKQTPLSVRCKQHNPLRIHSLQT